MVTLRKKQAAALTFENFLLTDTRNEKRNSIDALQQQVRALREEMAALDAKVKELAEQKGMLEKQKIDTGTLSEDAQHAIAQLQKDLESAAAREGNEQKLLTSKKTQLDEARAAHEAERQRIEEELESLQAAESDNGKALDEMQTRRAALQSSAEQVTMERNKLQAEAHSLEETRLQAEKDIVELQEEIAGRRDLMDKTAAEFEQLREHRQVCTPTRGSEVCT